MARHLAELGRTREPRVRPELVPAVSHSDGEVREPREFMPAGRQHRGALHSNPSPARRRDA